MPENSTGNASSKVATLIEKYSLEEMGRELEVRWTGDGVERLSLRALETFFNERLLEAVLFDAGMNTLEDNVENIYQNLTDETATAGVTAETQNRLERNGVDVGDLERDFVSYQAIRSYLQEWRGAEYEQISKQEKLDKDVTSINRLITRTSSVTTDRISNLRKTGRIDIEEFEVFVDAQVLCQQCGKQYTVDEFFENEGCTCLKE